MQEAVEERYLIVVVDGPELSSRSESLVDPQRPFVLYRDIPRLPPGEYLAAAFLITPYTRHRVQVEFVRH